MRRILLLAVAAVLMVVGANAGAQTVTFAGERFALAHQNTTPDGRKLAEYVRAGESVQTWTKLVAFHAFPGPSDAKAAAGALARTLRQAQPDVRTTILENPQTGEVMIDFTLMPANSDTIEFNVFKYSPAPSGKSLVALQFAQRMKRDTAPSGNFPDARRTAIDAMAAFAMAPLAQAAAR